MSSTFGNRVEEQFLNELPLVIYRKPEQKDVIGIFQETSEVHFISDFSVSGFVFAPFDCNKKPILIKVDEKLVTKDFIAPSTSETIDFAIGLSQKDFHIELVEKGISRIKNGDFKKVVLSRRLKVKTNENALALFQKILATYNTAFCYLWYHPKVGIWLGATPEILLSTTNKQFMTMSLAGTQIYGKDGISEWGKKELQEQALVTDYVTNALADKVIDLQVSALETLRAGSLLHLQTRITGRINSKLEDVIQALHPTPAVCGMPMRVTKDFILNNENYDREFYTGFLGELNLKEEFQRAPNRRNQENQAYRAVKTCSELFVNLRCMKLVQDTAFIYVGGGITVDSIPEKEWQETVGKSHTMLKIVS